MAAVVSRGDIQPVKSPPQAQPFPLSDVRLLDGPFRDAMLRDQKYLLSLDPDRLLRKFRMNVGLPSTAKPYGGWESPNTELRGHTLGHYLSACSLMYASTGDARIQAARGLHRRRTRRVPEQFPGGGFSRRLFVRVSRNRSLTAWNRPAGLGAVVYAAQNLAGLLDANQSCGNQQALEVLDEHGQLGEIPRGHI